MRRLLAVCAAFGCGRMGFERTQSEGPDAPADSPADAQDACTGAWGAPQHIVELATSGEDWGPALAPDGLSLVFHSNRGGGAGSMDLYRSTRTAVTAPFDPPINLSDLNSSASDKDASLPTSGARIYFGSSRLGGNAIFVADRVGVGFGAPLLAVGIQPPDGTAPWISDDELEILYSASGTVFRATRSSVTASWGPGTALGELGAGMGFPSMTSDGLSLYLECPSTPSGLCLATRSSRGQVFSLAAEFADVGTGADPDVSRDGATIMFGSNRAGGMGGHDLYVSRRACL